MYLYMNSFIRLKSTFSITNMFLLINRMILTLESNPLTPKIVTIEPISTKFSLSFAKEM